MREVTQTILANEMEDVYGNCLQAAVASLFDRPIEAVPHFVHFESRWLPALELWLEGNGLGTVEYRRSSRGVPRSGMNLLYGYSPRNIKHVCVGDGPTVVWDPHPSRDGLDRIQGCFVFSKWPVLDNE